MDMKCLNVDKIKDSSSNIKLDTGFRVQNIYVSLGVSTWTFSFKFWLLFCMDILSQTVLVFFLILR